MTSFREIPSIEQMRQRPAMAALERDYGRAAVVAALRAEANALRARLTAGGSETDVAAALERAAAERVRVCRSSLREVINATGVILHTNLGRAPLSERAAAAAAAAAAGYSNLEFDLARGGRGHRDVHAEPLLCSLTGAEAAAVVNNNAGAALLTLAALAAGREVLVSRGELVEIGGGFRVPDVMAQSGAVLREVGTTNRTRTSDYAAAIGERTALILRVHRSNFRIEGFTEEAPAGELATLGQRFNIPVIEDLGSGYLGVPPLAALRTEPSARRRLQQGLAAVLFSGDKLLGGPQAGIVVGTRAAIDPVRKHPLMRALRADKMTYAALAATLDAYAGERWNEIPVLRMLMASSEEIGVRAETLAAALRETGIGADVIDGESTIGGGSAPGETLPTRLVQIDHRQFAATELLAQLRRLDPPVIARIAEDRVVLDLRTVLPQQEDRLGQALGQLPAVTS